MLKAVFRGLRFRSFCGQDYLERIGQLMLDINVFEDDEVGSRFGLLKATLPAGNDYDWDSGQGGVVFDRSDEFAAAHHGHLDVGDNDVRAHPVQGFECLLSVGR